MNLQSHGEAGPHSGHLVGRECPTFRVQDTFGDWVGPGELSGGPALVVFFPFAFTPVCDQELTELNARIREFDDVAVLAISCDPIASLVAWQEHQGYVFDLGSDFWPHGKAARAFGVFNDVEGYARRGSFVLNPHGKITWSVVNPSGKPRSVDDYLAALAPWLPGRG